jgi:hypothetical protein
MKATVHPTHLCVLIAGLLLATSGCSKSGKDISVSTTPLQPKEAASQMQQAFVSASPEAKREADAASEYIRTANYEQAVQSLGSIKAKQNLTYEQGIAVYNSEQSLVARIITGVQAGDPNAKRAYELLKQQKRD